MPLSRRDTAIVLGIYATFALDAYSSLNSSPQTTEINAEARADTLMKWVYVGDAVALGGGLAASFVDGSPYPFIGALAVVVMMHVLYVHAKESGLKNGAPGTEDYR